MEDCAGYSIEEHGDGYVLYYGRDNDHHGFNLCKLSEFDSNGENTRSAIVKALNLLKDSQNETNDIKNIKKTAANTVVKHDAEICQRIVEDQLNYLIRAGLCSTDLKEIITIRDNLFKIVYSKLQQN